MELATALLLIVCYGLAAYLSWAQRTPIYVLAILGGHLSALASPLWRLLYGVRYSPDLGVVQTFSDQLVPTTLLVGAGWYYPLPALVVLFLHSTRWWFPGSVTGVLTYLIFLLYHLLIETVGLRTQIWAYNDAGLPLGLSTPLLGALMAGLISYGLLYTLLAVRRFTWPSMVVAVVPMPLALSLLIHGLLGAPLWLALLLDGEVWAVSAGLVTTLGLLFWAAQIITSGIRRLTSSQ